jgi:hypothetical protein
MNERKIMETDIRELAESMGVNEFQLFEQAYTHWYGQKPNFIQVEGDFVKYMMNQYCIPVYVKSYIGKLHFLEA